MSSFQVKYIYDLVDKITPQLQQIQSTLDQTSARVDRMSSRTSRSFQQTERSSSELVASLKRVAVAYLGIETARRAITTIAEFDKAISTVKAVTGATSDEMQSMRELAIDLGRSTQFSAREAANAMVELGKAGLKTSQIIQSMPAVLDLAAAGSLGLAEAAGISSNIMASFQIPAKEMVRVADTLSFAANASQTSVQEVGTAVSYVGQAATQANISLEQVSASIGVLSNMGIQGERAGTGLRRVLSELANPTKQAAEELSRYGITYKDINPQTNKFSDIMRKLQPISKDMNSSFKVFGDIGAGVFQILSKNVDEVDKLTLSLKNAKGSAAETAEVMRDNLGGDIDNLMSSIEGLMLTTGDNGFGLVLRSTIQLLTDLFGAFGGAPEAFNNLSTPLKFIVVLIRALGDGLAVAIGLFEKVFNFASKMFGGGSFGDKLNEAFMLQKELNVKDYLNGNNAVKTPIQPRQSVDVNVGGVIGFNTSGLPRGMNVNYTPVPNNGLPTGMMGAN